MIVIRCVSCLSCGSVEKIPDCCPICGARFNKHASQSSILDTLYNFFIGGDKGYIECDMHGWSTGDSLRFPYEKDGL